MALSEGSGPDSNANPASKSCDIANQTCQTTPTATWTQSAPVVNSAVLTSENVSVSPQQNVQADNFGNFFGQDLTVSKTATPSFTRTYNWKISKSVDKTLVEQIGGTATFNYTVEVDQDTTSPFTDSAWQVTGTITVSNPNGFDVTGVNVTDAVDDGGACSVTGGSNLTVPANGSASTITYTCTYTSAPSSPSGTNTATATWVAATFGTPDSSAQGTATFDFSKTTPTTVNKTVTVTDKYWTNLPNPTTATLGTCTATDAATFATCTFTYSRGITVKPGCNFYDNQAKISETGQYANKEVEVCGPAATGALTMGFWQNKNGQGIITAYCGGTSGTSLHAFLTSYYPFSDETATTCSGEATYVYNVINAAVCTSTSKTCNSMLKAQTLATALDVYFSDPSLGGNKIAPAPIGGVSIDLSSVCNMIDGTGGTATCSGSFSNVSAEFGGATCLTVLGMLNYQNTADPAADAGALSYGNIKAQQVAAKNAFDAVNNRVAFPCP